MTAPVYSVSEITRRIKELLETEIDRLWVSGEISSLKVHPSSGHAYFNLKDERAVIACTLWATTLRRLPHRPVEGARVRIFGAISVYEPRGSYQLNVQQLLPEGEGELQAAFLALKRKLEAEGLFDPARKRPLPRMPRRIGIATSPSGAALRDMIRILRRRWPSLHVVLRPAAVQGAGAAQELAAAIADLNRLPDLDLVIVGRGGGSLEDLWAFNEEPLARAIASSRLPVISAVGHETDFTISDFVADVRAATPSHAAEIAVPDQEEVRRRLARDGRGLRVALTRWFERMALRLDRLRHSRALRKPDEKIARARLDLDRAADRLRAGLLAPVDRRRARLRLAERRLLGLHPALRLESSRGELSRFRGRLASSMQARLTRARERRVVAEARLDALSPLKVLDRGYSIVRHETTGRIVRLASETQSGDGLDLIVARGQLRVRVESSDEAAGPTGARASDEETRRA